MGEGVREYVTDFVCVGSHYCIHNYNYSMRLQSDTKHKANQHQILADSLVEEVIRPISSLKDQMAKKEISLFGQYTKMNNELQQLEESFKKKSAQFSKAYQNAMSNVSSCRKYGISNEEYKQVRENYPTVFDHSLCLLLIYKMYIINVGGRRCSDYATSEQ